MERKIINKVLIANCGDVANYSWQVKNWVKKVSLFFLKLTLMVFGFVPDECYPIMGDPINAYLDYDVLFHWRKADCDAISPLIRFPFGER